VELLSRKGEYPDGRSPAAELIPREPPCDNACFEFSTFSQEDEVEVCVTTQPSPSVGDRLAALRIDRDRFVPSNRGKYFGLALGLLVVVILVGSGGAVLWSGGDEWLSSAIEVDVARAEVTTQSLLSANGYLESRQQAAVGAKVPGRIQEIKVEEGQRVKAGEVMVVLEHDDLNASLSAMRASLTQAKADLDQAEETRDQHERWVRHAGVLFQKGFMSPEAYEQEKSQLRSALRRCDAQRAAIAAAEARVAEAEQVRDNMFVFAPFSGTVITKDAELGETITPGGMGEASGRGSVVTLADLDHLEVDTDVKEDFISRVSLGQPAEVAVDSVPDRRYRGRLRKVIPMGDRARGTIKVKVEILDADERLFPEMSATVHFLPQDEGHEAGEPQATLISVPEAAVRQAEQSAYVWTVAEDRARRVEIEPGAARDGRVQVARGLKGGESVIVDPPPELKEGTRVRNRK
jgi:RND family efflux transporter MFP subunit